MRTTDPRSLARESKKGDGSLQLGGENPILLCGIDSFRINEKKSVIHLSSSPPFLTDMQQAAFEIVVVEAAASGGQRGGIESFLAGCG